MFITRIEATGFGGLPKLDARLSRVERINGSPRALTALEDALLLAFAPWDRAAADTLLARWRCATPTVSGDVLVEGAHWDHAPGLQALLLPGSDGLLSVGVTLELDPPQYGRLRKEAARDPRLVDALSEGAQLTLRVGARFSPALDAVAFDLLAFSMSGIPFAIAGADRPAWMTPFLRPLGARVHVGPVSAAVWSRRSGSYAAADQRAVRAALATLGTGPARLGPVAVLPGGPALVKGEEIIPLHLLGERAEREAGMLAAVHLSGADVLVLRDTPSRWGRWFGAQVEGPTSPLEQILLLGHSGGIELG